MYNCSEVIPIEERKWTDIPACQHFRGNTFEAEVPKLVMRWVHCEMVFRRLEGKNSRTLIGFSMFTKEATKLGSRVARIPETSYCTFVPFKDTLVGT